jgi:hypothetical protein
MGKIFTFKKSEYWGDGHWIVLYPEGEGRVSRAEDGTWSAFDWITKIAGVEGRPALADGLSTRKDAAIVLRTVDMVAEKMHAETDQLIDSMEKRSCGHL